MKMEQSLQKRTSFLKVILIPTVVAITMAIIELTPAAQAYRQTMGVFEFLSHVISGAPYYFALILVLAAAFPVTYCMFKESGIKLGSCIINKKKLPLDIVSGILAAALSYGFSFLVNQVILRYPVWRPGFNGIWILSFFSLVLASGFFKEIYFRGLANHFLKTELGEWPAFLLINLLFAVLDWQNLGMSFVYGLIWIYFYRKRNRMIVPIIGHGFHNLIAMSIGFLI